MAGPSEKREPRAVTRIERSVDRKANRDRLTTKRTRRPEERRGEILDAALDLFSERGYHATGVADIAAELNMSHGTFYNYFNSKRDLVEQMIDGAEARIAEWVGAPAQTEALGDYRAEAQRLVGGVLRVIHGDPRLARLLLFEATGVDEAMTARMLALVDRMRQTTSDFLRHGVRQGWLRADLAVVETARAINGIIYAGAIRAAREGGDSGRYVLAALRLVFDGVSA
jgi:AcrR family transcriptional regulator